MILPLSIILCLLVAGALVGFFLGRRGVNSLQKALSGSQTELARSQAMAEAQVSRYLNEMELQKQNHNALMEAEREKASKEKEMMNAAFDTERRALKEANEEYKRSQEETRQKTELMKKEFQNLANQILEDKSSSLKTANREQLDAVLTPLKENIDKLGKSVQDNRVSSAQYKESIEQALKGLMEKTEKIGSDAVNLTKALKANPKVQGDWGEMILERMLEESGLRKDEEYFIQENCVTEEGKNVRPDVIIRFPEKRSVIIDSKVSLTAYVKSVSAETEMEREEALAVHVASVKKHIDELAAKDYSRVVKDSIGYVLMFVPNEGSYITAIEREKDLLSYAYKRRIIVISPSNLMMALQLAYNLWQSEKQTRNVEEIIKRGNMLYEKFVTFATTFEKVGDRIKDAQTQYDSAMVTLSKGNGNLISSLDKMKKLGLNPKKEISATLRSKVEEEESEL